MWNGHYHKRCGKRRKRQPDPLFSDCVPFSELKKQIKQERSIESAGLTYVSDWGSGRCL
jgi:hypothetical protein